MLDHYKRTFWSMQAVIAPVTAAVYFGMHRLWFVTATFFVTMQVGSALGAVWASRLKRKFQAHVS